MALGVRRSITDLQKDYDSGNKAPLENLMRAWKGIKELPPTDPNSFFISAATTASRSAARARPIRPGGAATASTAPCCSRPGTAPICGGSSRRCRAFRAAPTCSCRSGTRCSTDSQQNGIPRALTDENFVLDGETIPNPLRSFVLAGRDRRSGHCSSDPTPNYSKPAGIRDGALSALRAGRHAGGPGGDGRPQRRLPQLRRERQDCSTPTSWPG